MNSITLFLLSLILIWCYPVFSARAMTYNQFQQQILSVVEPELKTWLASIPPEMLDGFGFHSAEEKSRASLLDPISFSTPLRSKDQLKKAKIEKALEEKAISWLVPVVVDQRIVAVVVVDTVQGKEPTPVEFGKTYTANRLDAGIRALGWPTKEKWHDLRYLSFVSPNYDLLLYRKERSWVWLNLRGTLDGTAHKMSLGEIEALLEQLNHIHSGSNK